MLKLFEANDMVRLSRELSYIRTWDPKQHPEWLLIEIDGDFSIRPEQASLAAKMLVPDNRDNAVMQLNMGEGKSSVIIPIIAVDLAAQPDILPRIIVPRANLRQQFHMLRRTITGLCRRSIIYMPFTRNLRFDEFEVDYVQKLLECATENGMVWLTEPEHVLSNKLLGLDRVLRNSTEAQIGHKLIGGQIWLQKHIRDVIDECDEVLHTKQQVLYTIGHQQPLDAAPIRWDVTQKFLGLIAHYVQKWKLDHLVLQADKPIARGCFPHIRLRSEDGLNFLTQVFMASIQEGYWSIPPYLKSFAWRIGTSRVFSERDKEIIRECNSADRPEWQIIQVLMILRGTIQSNILLRALTDKGGEFIMALILSGPA